MSRRDTIERSIIASVYNQADEFAQRLAALRASSGSVSEIIDAARFPRSSIEDIDHEGWCR